MKPYNFQNINRHFPLTCVLILNYNNWADTIECLESVLKLDYPHYFVVLVDNGSIDNSALFFNKWATGELDTWLHPQNSLKSLLFPLIEKPVTLIELHHHELQNKGWKILNQKHLEHPLEYCDQKIIYFIRKEKNDGFAAGINVGIQFVLNNSIAKYIWLLNNDTVVDPHALKFLIKNHLCLKKQGKKIGLMGSKLLYYDRPDVIQALGGGKYYKWLAISKHIGENTKDIGQSDHNFLPIDYIVGASLLVPIEFIFDIGLMCEDYFLYYEELDWAVRGRKKGWGLSYSLQSKVYHKEGRTIGSNLDPKKRSWQSEYYALRNRLVFTKRFYPQFLPTVVLGLMLSLINGLRRKQFYRIKLIFKIMKDLLF